MGFRLVSQQRMPSGFDFLREPLPRHGPHNYI